MPLGDHGVGLQQSVQWGAGADTDTTRTEPGNERDWANSQPWRRRDISRGAVTGFRIRVLASSGLVWGMFLSADVVVKVVMVGLALASFVTWTVALAKRLEIFASRRRLRAALRELTDAQSLAQAASLPGVTRSLREPVEAALAEIRLSPEIADKDSIKQRMVSRLERVEAATGRALVRGTGALATIGATAPFIGLFGTVWGIMNSFIGISQQHTTNLAPASPRRCWPQRSDSPPPFRRW